MTQVDLCEMVECVNMTRTENPHCSLDAVSIGKNGCTSFYPDHKFCHELVAESMGGTGSALLWELLKEKRMQQKIFQGGIGKAQLVGVSHHSTQETVGNDVGRVDPLMPIAARSTDPIHGRGEGSLEPSQRPTLLPLPSQLRRDTAG